MSIVTRAPSPYTAIRGHEGYQLHGPNGDMIADGMDSHGAARLLVICNAHDDLVSALQMAKDHIINLHGILADAAELGLTVSICGSTYQPNKIMDALAKAGAA